MCLDVDGELWRVSWHPVDGEARELGVFNIEEALATVTVRGTFRKEP